jgi:hypothetical protein
MQVTERDFLPVNLEQEWASLETNPTYLPFMKKLIICVLTGLLILSCAPHLAESRITLKRASFQSLSLLIKNGLIQKDLAFNTPRN